MLREYQRTAIDSVFGQMRSGVSDSLLVSPTGSGKTVIAADICRQGYERGRRILFVATRQPLIAQTAKKLSAFGVSREHIGLIQGANSETQSAPVQVASLQTLARRKWWKAKPFDLIIYDEAHESRFHKAAQTVRELSPNGKVLGLTATPYRTKSSETLGKFFNGLVVTRLVRELQADGFLAKADYYAAGEETDVSTVRIASDGDYNQDDLQQACNSPELIDDAIAHWQALAGGKRTIVFATGIAHADAIRDRFQSLGVRAEVVTGETPEKRRNILYKRMRSGSIPVLISVGVLTTGFDEPSVECLLLLRKTLSRSLHEQMIGRGLRISPETGKEKCIVIDQARNCLVHGVPELIDGYELDPPKDKKKRGEADPRLKVCPACSNYSTDPKRCDNCGYEFPILDSQVVEIENPILGFSKIAIPEDPAVRHRAQFRKLCAQAFKKGYQPMWVQKRWAEAKPDGCKGVAMEWWDRAATEHIEDTWQAIHAYKSHLEFLARKHNKANPGNWVHHYLCVEFAEDIDLISDLEDFDQLDDQPESYYAKEPTHNM
jgi:superfamily II DNA or RNA helicase